MRRLFIAAAIIGAFIAGGLTPAAAGTGFEDSVVRQLERISDGIRKLADRDVKVVCECRS